MLTCHELFAFMSPALAREIVEFAFTSDKPLYRLVLAAVAEAYRVRPAFLERRPRVQRHLDMVATLSRPRLEEAAANLLRTWLVKSQKALLVDFLDQLGIPHEDGVVTDFPETVEDAKLTATVENLLAKHPRENVAIYLNTVKATSGIKWDKLGELLQNEPRLQLG